MTRKDLVLSKVWSLTLIGWPAHVHDQDLEPYFSRRHQLTLEGGVILWGLRVVIAPQFQERLLAELQEQHPGIYRMKALGRSYVWWPGIDQQIEGKVKGCHSCIRTANSPPTAPTHHWTWPTKPW